MDNIENNKLDSYIKSIVKTLKKSKRMMASVLASIVITSLLMLTAYCIPYQDTAKVNEIITTITYLVTAAFLVNILVNFTSRTKSILRKAEYEIELDILRTQKRISLKKFKKGIMDIMDMDVDHELIKIRTTGIHNSINVFSYNPISKNIKSEVDVLKDDIDSYVAATLIGLIIQIGITLFLMGGNATTKAISIPILIVGILSIIIMVEINSIVDNISESHLMDSKKYNKTNIGMRWLIEIAEENARDEKKIESMKTVLDKHFMEYLNLDLDSKRTMLRKFNLLEN